MKLFLDLKNRRFVKSAASNVALDRLVLKRRDTLPIEVIYVENGALATPPAGTTAAVGLKAKFSDATFLAYAAPGQTTLDLYTLPVEAAFSLNPATVSALLEIRWGAPGTAHRTAALQVELQNAVILGTEATPATIPDGKATQAEAITGTDNTKWMTPLRTAQAIAVLAPPPTWDAVQNKPELATLVNGLVPSTQLPSYVDDVLEFANLAALPATGETGKIYITLDTRKAHRWTGSTYLEISPSEVTSVAGRTGAVTLALEDLTNFGSLSATAYKPTSCSAEVTTNSSDSYSAAQLRSQAWTITFRAPRTIDFFLPTTMTDGQHVSFAPQLGDLYTAEILETGSFTGQWTARFKRPDGSVFHTVTRADSDLEKSSLRFVYNGTSWVLDRTVYHQHTYTDLLGTPPDVATGYFDRAGDAINRGGYMGQAPYQVVLANDTRLIDPRRTAFVSAPATPTTIANGLQPGAQAYDGSYLYTLVPMPGGQTMRWARIAMSTTW